MLVSVSVFVELSRRSVLSTWFFFLMLRRPPRSTLDRSSAASDVYKRQELNIEIGILSAMEIQTVNFSNKILQEAAKQQSELRKEWSLLTGQDYPELGMPKR